MLYLLWAVLNIGLFLLFIYVAYRATRLLRQHLGTGAALFFVIGLLSFVSSKNVEEDGFKSANEKNTSVNLQQQNYYSALLEDNAAFHIRLDLVTNKPTAAAPFETVKYYTHVTGFVAGHQWKPATATFNYRSGQVHYEVHGIIRWRLLGIPVYAQPKIYKGTIAT